MPAKKKKSRAKAGPSAPPREKPATAEPEIGELLDLVAAGQCGYEQTTYLYKLYREGDPDARLKVKKAVFERETRYFAVLEDYSKHINIRKLIGRLEFQDASVMLSGVHMESAQLPPIRQRPRPGPKRSKKDIDRQKDLIRIVPTRRCTLDDDLEFVTRYNNDSAFREAVFRAEAAFVAIPEWGSARLVRELIGYLEFEDVLIMIPAPQKEEVAYGYDVYKIAQDRVSADPSPENILKIVKEIYRGDMSLEEAARQAGPGPRRLLRAFYDRDVLQTDVCSLAEQTLANSRSNEGRATGPSRNMPSPSCKTPEEGDQYHGQPSVSQSSGYADSSPAQRRSETRSRPHPRASSVPRTSRDERSSLVGNKSLERFVQAQYLRAPVRAGTTPTQRPGTSASNQAIGGEKTGQPRKTPSPPQRDTRTPDVAQGVRDVGLPLVKEPSPSRRI